MINQTFKEQDKTETCQLCKETLKPGKAVWLELIEGSNKFYFNGIPAKAKSQGWFPFGSACARKVRRYNDEL